MKEGSTLTSPEQRKEGFSLDDQILDDAMDVEDRLVFPRPYFLLPWAPGWEHTAAIGLGLAVCTQAAERQRAPREGTTFLRHVLVSISSHCCQTHARPLSLPSQSQVLNRNISSRTVYAEFSLVAVPGKSEKTSMPNSGQKASPMTIPWLLLYAGFQLLESMISIS